TFGSATTIDRIATSFSSITWEHGSRVPSPQTRRNCVRRALLSNGRIPFHRNRGSAAQASQIETSLPALATLSGRELHELEILARLRDTAGFSVPTRRASWQCLQTPARHLMTLCARRAPERESLTGSPVRRAICPGFSWLTHRHTTDPRTGARGRGCRVPGHDQSTVGFPSDGSSFRTRNLRAACCTPAPD